MKSKADQYGFTLVELMVVVAIIGILIAVASPFYWRYQSRARQSEARMVLGGVFVAEQSFAAEFASFTECLTDIGVAAQGSQIYYSVGLNTYIGAATCGTTGALHCGYTNWPNNLDGVPCKTSNAVGGNPITANSKVGAGAVTTSANITGAGLPAAFNGSSGLLGVSQNAFGVGSAGMISSASTTPDEWSIDNNKNLVHNVSQL